MTSSTTDDLWSDHGLTEQEFRQICDALGRQPNRVELGICGAMWSEHCSYKSSRKWLAKLPTEGETVVQGPGENAGIVRLEGDCCIAFKVESHNHPSFIEPYHGAATGVGGIMRDVFTMGARPIANLNSLRFGEPDHEKTPFLLDGVVRGIADYGNCMGVPTVGGETVFSASYNGNILVNAMNVGVVREDKIFLGYASGVGNPVFYIGSATGGDGIHGATMASASFEDGQEDQRPAVQVGDPFTEKLLLEACLELMESGAVIGIQDMGAAGLTSSSFEMASRAGSGMDLHLDRVPRRQEGLGPYELMLSESQERMLVVLERGKEQVAYDILGKWDLQIANIGVVTDTGAVRCYWHDDLCAELPVPLLVDQAPKLDRPYAASEAQIERQKRTPTVPADLDIESTLLTLLGHATLADKSWIHNQYDATVQANTVLASGADAAVVWVPEAGRAVAMCVEGNSRMTFLNPRTGAQHIVAEGIRNLACAGALPLGATDCLNFGNPQRPEYFWQFTQVIEGLASGLREMETPIVSGNVSLYNETSGEGVWPTPTLGFIGKVIVDPGQLPGAAWTRAGLQVALIGTPANTLAGSAYQELVDGDICGDLQTPDWEQLRAIQRLLVDQIGEGAIDAAHDVAEGGLLVALAEMAIASGIGLDGDTLELGVTELFGEGSQAVVVAVEAAIMPSIVNACAKLSLSCLELGTSGGDRLSLPGIMNPGIDTLRAPWAAALPAIVAAEKTA